MPAPEEILVLAPEEIPPSPEEAPVQVPGIIHDPVSRDIPVPQKRNLRQNISSLLSSQLHELELVDPAQEELLPETGLDIEKTYGNASSPGENDIISDDLLTLDVETEEKSEIVIREEPEMLQKSTG